MIYGKIQYKLPFLKEKKDINSIKRKQDEYKILIIIIIIPLNSSFSASTNILTVVGD